MPTMSHPNSRLKIDVAPAQVSLYAASGWRKYVSPRAKSTPRATDETQSGETVANNRE
jgi:hypothetical protein